jgi:phospholipid/cholesterol/gamma-HCH transport system ATP-binding protein
MEKKIVKADTTTRLSASGDYKKAFEDYHVLRGIDLDLYQGENLVVLGRSGTGKSVLIKIISDC